MTRARNLADLLDANGDVKVGNLDNVTTSDATTSASGLMSAADKTKIDGIEASATADQTDAEIRAAVEAVTDSNVFTDADHSKLNGIETSADVTDATNVASAGALMTSGGTVNGDFTFTGANYNLQWDKSDNSLEFGDNARARFGNSNDLQIYHNGTYSQILDIGTGDLWIGGDANINIANAALNEYKAQFATDGAVTLYHNNSAKFTTNSSGVSITGTLAATALTGDGSALTGVEAFPAGTRMLFHQSAAPTGWTKDTSSHNNKAIRCVTGSVSSGGSNSFTNAFGNRTVSVSGTTGNTNATISGSGTTNNTNASISGSGTTGNTSLSLAQLPSHNHPVSVSDTVGNVGAGSSGGNSIAAYTHIGGYIGHTSTRYQSQKSQNQGSGNSHNHSFSFSGSSNHNHSFSFSGSSNHSHSFSASGTADINVQYFDVIIAQKN